MGIVSAALAERVPSKVSMALLPSLVSSGVARVIYRYVAERKMKKEAGQVFPPPYFPSRGIRLT